MPPILSANQVNPQADSVRMGDTGKERLTEIVVSAGSAHAPSDTSTSRCKQPGRFPFLAGEPSQTDRNCFVRIVREDVHPQLSVTKIVQLSFSSWLRPGGTRPPGQVRSAAFWWRRLLRVLRARRRLRVWTGRLRCWRSRDALRVRRAFMPFGHRLLRRPDVAHPLTSFLAKFGFGRVAIRHVEVVDRTGEPSAARPAAGSHATRVVHGDTLPVTAMV